MKPVRSWVKDGWFLILSLFFLAGVARVYAQTVDSNLVPVVTVQATQPIATVTNSGVFTLFRAGNTNATLNVWYDLDGTASNGVDYAAISQHLVEIAAGATSNTVVITPLTNPPANAFKTVVLTLTNSPLMTPVNYEIGLPSRAVVGIESTNLPPPVAIQSPKEGTVFYTPTNIAISAYVVPLSTNVEFFAGTNDLGSGNPGPYAIGFGASYSFVWTNPPPGDYALTAVVVPFGSGSTSLTSAPVNITVLQGPPTNQPPVLEISSPTNGQTFYGSVVCPSCLTNNPPCELPCYFEGPDIPIYTTVYATASPTNPIASVEFFADGQDLGPGALQGCVMPAITCVGCPPPVMTCTYSLVWTNAPLGNHILTAIAIDNDGLSSTSAPVKISVINGPPPTNLPPVVRIVSPANGSVFPAPINLPIYAYANDHDDIVASVQFFAGTNDLGFGQRVPVITPLADGTLVVGGPVPPIYPTNLFFLVWSNAPAGDYPLTAVATGNGGLSATSAPVNITILSPLPPPTNNPPIVTIVATDPVAIEGTNSWIWQGETNSPPTWVAWPAAVCLDFTNCAPKTATFTVRRCGDTNQNLTVPYDLGGTARNGVDYVGLPGFVSIPAGQRRALITIVPIDDGPPDVNKTVILALTPSTNMPPNYRIGFPRRAAAIIIDHGPCPATGMLPGHCFHLKGTGPNAAWFCIEYSTNLVNWTPVCTNQVIDGSIDFVDPEVAGNAPRFYRAVPLTNPPSE